MSVLAKLRRHRLARAPNSIFLVWISRLSPALLRYEVHKLVPDLSESEKGLTSLSGAYRKSLHLQAKYVDQNRLYMKEIWVSQQPIPTSQQKSFYIHVSFARPSATICTLQSSFDTLRPLSYPDADVFVIVYSVVDPQSFAEISAHWIPEINRGNPVAQSEIYERQTRIPSHQPQPVLVLLVGTQVDLRWQCSKDTVSTAKGRQLASQIGAEFFECSALTQHNLKQVRQSATFVLTSSTSI